MSSSNVSQKSLAVMIMKNESTLLKIPEILLTMLWDQNWNEAMFRPFFLLFFFLTEANYSITCRNLLNLEVRYFLWCWGRLWRGRKLMLVGSRQIFTVIVVYKGEVRRWSGVAGNPFNLGYNQHPQYYCCRAIFLSFKMKITYPRNWSISQNHNYI